MASDKDLLGRLRCVSSANQENDPHILASEVAAAIESLKDGNLRSASDLTQLTQHSTLEHFNLPAFGHFPMLLHSSGITFPYTSETVTLYKCSINL